LTAGLALLAACGPADGTPSRSTAPASQPAASRVPATTPAAQGPALQSAAAIPRAKAGQEEIILATTTSTQDSGLLDVLVPEFERATGYRVKPIAVGTGQALTLGARGEADVVLVHAPDSERTWMAEGNGVSRLLVMHNDYVLVGPAADPAGVRGAPSAAEALKRIAAKGATFVSRGDNSGTHQLETAVWKSTGSDSKGQSWYLEAGQGMGATLNIASEREGYTLTDRGTFLARRSSLSLQVLVEGSAELLNVYHVMPVSAGKFPRVNQAGGEAFAAFMVSREAQATIEKFGVDKYGQPLFFPDAGKPEPVV
jgi:tungstate transport system substrate-binding protein